MKRDLFKSVLLRYMVSYAILMAILFMAVGLYMGGSYARTARETTVQNAVNRLGTLRFRHEEKLGALVRIGNQIGMSYYITPFRMDEQPMNAYHIKQQIAPYTLTNDFIDQLYLIYSQDHYLYSSATSADIDMFVEKLMRYEHISPEELRAFLRSPENRGPVILPGQQVRGSLTGSASRQMVTVFVPLSIGEKYNVGNVMFLIRDEKYQQMFAEEIYTPHSTYIFLGEDVLAASRGLALADADVLAALSDQADSIAADVTLSGQNCLLVALRSNAYDMWYATAIPQSAVQAQFLRYQLTLGLFLLLLAVPCMLLTIFFSRRHVRPIKDLRTLLDAPAQGHDDFQAIRSGIAALSERNEALHTSLKKNLPLQKEWFITSLVKGGFAQRADAVAQAAALGMDVDKPCYVVALVDTPREEETPPDADALIALGEGRVTGYAVQLIAQEHMLFVAFADEPEALERWCAAVKQYRRAEHGALTVSVSNIQHDFADAGSAYLEASTAYDNRFVLGTGHVLRFADVSMASRDVTPFLKACLDGFRGALRSRNARALNDRMHELFQYLAHTELSLFAFRVIYNQVIGTLLGEQPEDAKGVDARRYYDVFMLSHCQSIDDLDEVLRMICRDILENEPGDSASESPLVGNIIAYMHAHFTDPMLNMSAVADVYGISAARLSLEFKEVTEMNPSEYLLLLRMERAKELLVQTEMPVKDVGEAVGYFDASGFIRRFKKYANVTPAQYRKSARERGEGLAL
ncbi:MAG: helix-turn-helix domain-containing protein [Oscillospiraceae bacterium]|jgi:AraC-like DNA-binding protein|nr:helix-turn-helix domain-containing protein [Oscillospiraceae bacterium]